jgi:hypothetical protein
MKKFAGLGLVMFGMIQSVPSFGLVRMVESCQTSDGKYQVSIMDNQGTGMVRSSHYGATVQDENGNNLGTYDLKYIPKFGSVSFGHSSYVDQETGGKKFDFALPSTNTPYSIVAALSNGEEITYGVRFDPEGKNQGELTCSKL